MEDLLRIAVIVIGCEDAPVYNLVKKNLKEILEVFDLKKVINVLQPYEWIARQECQDEHFVIYISSDPKLRENYLALRQYKTNRSDKYKILFSGVYSEDNPEDNLWKIFQQILFAIIKLPASLCLPSQ
ncbi:MAG: hypothetical protein WCV55_03420 [Candidatus Paceibacterota bacterium]